MAFNFGNAIGSALGALGNITGSFSTGGGTNMKDTKELMAIQNGYYRSNYQWQNENGWKFLRQGLINADYNPLLAVGTSPQGSWAPTAQATDGTTSMSVDGAASMQANTARKLSESQIELNKATANETAEKAITQQSVRENNHAQALLAMLQSDRISKLLPYDVKKAAAEIAVMGSVMSLNYSNSAKARAEAEYIPKNYDLENEKFENVKDVTVQEQKYREEHPIYNWVDRWTKAISPWAMPVVIGSTANSHNFPETTYTEKAKFDSNGTYKGHTRTRTTRRKGK